MLICVISFIFQDDLECARSIKKGLLWQQKDKFFSRWKERFFILTKDYLHCFKKENSRISISEMGNFILKVLYKVMKKLEPFFFTDKAVGSGVCLPPDQERLPHNLPQSCQGW